MPRRDRNGERTATLYARGDLPRPAAERRNELTRHLADVAAGDALDGFDVVHWAKRVPSEGAPTRERALLSEFRQWADEEGVSLAPCFETRRCYSQDSGERRREIVLPVLCLAVSDGERLVEVSPHATGEGVVTVTDALERLDGEAATDHERRSRDGVAMKRAQ